MSLVFMAVDPGLPPYLNMEFLRTVAFPFINTIAAVFSLSVIVVWRVLSKKWRYEALFAFLPLAAAAIGFMLYSLDFITEDVRTSITRGMFFIFILAPCIPSLIELYKYAKERYMLWKILHKKS